MNEIGKLLRQGVFDGQLWVGMTSQTDTGGWLGSVHHVPFGMPQFVDFSAEVFDKPEDAELFVVREWERRFGE